MPHLARRPPVPLLEVDLADDEFIVLEYSDGMFSLEMSGPRLVLSADQFQQIVGGLVRIGKAKGWI